MITLGIDPDTQATGFALVDKETGPICLGVLDRAGKQKGLAAAVAQISQLVRLRELPAPPDLVIVEYQEHYHGRGQTNPNNLMLLSMITGAAVAIMGTTGAQIAVPYPKQWKGGVPKGIHQKRILDQLGWEYTDNGKKRPPKPVFPAKIPVIGDIDKGHKEVVDAIGLAQWGFTLYDSPHARTAVL